MEGIRIRMRMRGRRGYRLQAVGYRELEPDALARRPYLWDS